MVLEKFQSVREELTSALIERDSEIDLLLTSLVAREHVCFVGAPGTAKTMLADAICSWLHGSFFSRLLTKFSTPEELFGPISVQGLKNDEFRRVTKGKLPHATIGVLDEIWKSSSAILNTILQLANERTYDNDGVRMDCPLVMLIGCSNEYPSSYEGGKELGALFDRFLFRKEVVPIVSDRGLHKLIWSDSVTPNIQDTITPEDLDTASTEAEALPWTEDAKEALMAILQQCKKEGIRPGDRRIRKCAAAARAAAWIDDASGVLPDHLDVLQHVLWVDPEQTKPVAKIVGKIANPTGMQANSLRMEAEQVLSNTDQSELAQVVTAAKKLDEIRRKLKKIGTERADGYAEYVKDQIEGMRASSVAAVTGS